MTEPVNIKPLTSLRFFAAMWVVMFHYWPKLDASGMPPLVAKGYLGVECFFVLSGFILCHVYLPPYEAGRFKYADFLWARLARIYPLHLATMAGMGLMAAVALALGFQADPNVLSLAALPANLTLTQAWGLAPVAGWNHPSWSISAEWFAYLMFPLFALAAIALRARPWLAVAGAVALMAGLYTVFPLIAGFPLTKATIAWGALRIVPCFSLGCALYLAWRGWAADRRTAVAGAYVFGAAALVCAQFGAPDLLTVASFGGLIITLAQGSKTGATLGSSPILVYLGEVSYSVYMVCIPWMVLCTNVATKILHLDGKQLPLFAWLILLVTVVPVAAASHHLIERPARRWMKLWYESRQSGKFSAVSVR